MRQFFAYYQSKMGIDTENDFVREIDIHFLLFKDPSIYGLFAKVITDKNANL